MKSILEYETEEMHFRSSIILMLANNDFLEYEGVQSVIQVNVEVEAKVPPARVAFLSCHPLSLAT